MTMVDAGTLIDRDLKGEETWTFSQLMRVVDVHLDLTSHCLLVTC